MRLFFRQAMAASLLALTAAVPAIAQSTAAPVPVSEQTMQQLRVRSVPPVYPMTEKSMHQSGDVTLRVLLAEDGSIQSVTPVQATSQAFAEAAAESVRQWIYRPYILNGRPMSVEGEVQIHFRIH